MDTFGRFVALIAEQLAGDADGHPSPKELAAQLFLSRSQLDRIVTAVAGETPTGFRRRVLLERAAYQLRTTSATILAIAVAAGFGSHEAFTRAFTRAYGATPAAWRASARPWRLTAPNGVHFYPPGGLRLPVRKQVIDVDLVAGMVEHHIEVLRELIRAAATLEPEQLDEPIHLSVAGIDANPTVQSLLARLVGQLAMWQAAMANEPYDVAAERPMSLPELQERLEIAGPGFLAYVRSAGSYGETFVDATTERPYVFTAAGMIAHILTYAAYRRTLVVGALESAGRPVDDDPLSWFAA